MEPVMGGGSFIFELGADPVAAGFSNLKGIWVSGVASADGGRALAPIGKVLGG